MLLTSSERRKEDYSQLSTNEILDFIFQNHRVLIPSVPSDLFSQYEHLTMMTGELDRKIPNAQLTREEALETAITLDLLPNVGTLVQLILPFRNYKVQFYSAEYLGHDWPQYLNSDYVLPRNKFSTPVSAVEINLPENDDLDDPITKKDYDENIEFALNVREAWLKGLDVKHTINGDFLPTTYREDFQHMLIHDLYGHGFWESVGFAAAANVDEYRKLDYTTTMGENLLDINHPLMRSFAAVQGWELVPYRQYLDDFGQDTKQYILEKVDTAIADCYVWERRKNIWGGITDRKVRLNPYADYLGMHEAFAEYLSASVMRPDLLTSDELHYFRRIFAGMGSLNPIWFIEKVAQNPEILLDAHVELPPKIRQHAF